MVKTIRCFKCGRFSKNGNIFYGPPNFCGTCFSKAVASTYSPEEFEDWLEEQVADPFDKTAEDEIENEELGTAIMNCLSKLPEKQATVFRMKTIEGLDTEYICKELDITASNLWVIIHRARQAMAGCLEKNWF